MAIRKYHEAETGQRLHVRCQSTSLKKLTWCCNINRNIVRILWQTWIINFLLVSSKSGSILRSPKNPRVRWKWQRPETSWERWSSIWETDLCFATWLPKYLLRKVFICSIWLGDMSPYETGFPEKSSHHALASLLVRLTNVTYVWMFEFNDFSGFGASISVPVAYICKSWPRDEAGSRLVI